MMVGERLDALYASGDVQRLHTVPHLQLQNVGEHVYGSLIIAVELCRSNNVDLISQCRIMQHLLYHDAPEAWTGDIPAPVKRSSHAMRGIITEMEMDHENQIGYVSPALLTQMEKDITKASDTLDLMMKCVRERRLGNRTVRIEVVMANVTMYIQEQEHVAGVSEIADYFSRQWRAAGGS